MLFKLFECLHDLFFRGVHSKPSFKEVFRKLKVAKSQLGSSHSKEGLQVIRFYVEDLSTVLGARVEVVQFEVAEGYIFMGGQFEFHYHFLHFLFVFHLRQTLLKLAQNIAEVDYRLLVAACLQVLDC